MQTPKGMRDLFGEELKSVSHVLEVMRGAFSSRGFEEVSTPTVEYLELFQKKSGSSIVGQLYAFKDKSGQKLVLRPELTAPVARLYITQLRSAPKPVKVCYFGNCFRYEEPQAKRWREFFQSGAEIIGSDRPEADAEVISLSDQIMRQLGVPGYELRIGHIRLLREALLHAGVKEDAQDPIMRAIDSKEETRVEEEFRRAGIRGKDREVLESLIKLSGDERVLAEAEEITEKLPGVKSTLQNLRDVLKYSRALGVEKFRIDLGIARGLEYYTGCVFELYVDGTQVAGGGRYDELLELLGGEPCPAVGVGFGVDRIAQLFLERGGTLPKKELDCMVLPVKEEMLVESMKLAKELRASGFSVDVDLMARSLSKALSCASSRGVRYSVLVGKKDMDAGKVTLRDMRSGEQTLVPPGELKAKLKNLLQEK